MNMATQPMLIWNTFFQPFTYILCIALPVTFLVGSIELFNSFTHPTYIIWGTSSIYIHDID